MGSLIPAKELISFAERSLQKVGVSADDASTIANCLVEADVRGVHSHGINLLPRYVRGILKGDINAQPNVSIEHDRNVIVRVNADNGLGGIAAAYAADLAVERAKEFGLAYITVTNSNHFGAAAPYSMKIAKNKMIGTTITNTPSILPAFGGMTPVLGNNPLAIAVPTKEDPIVLDMALSPIARGKLRGMAEKGESIPPGWALTKEGHPTEDAAEAFDGITLPISGPKGYGLSLINELLSGALSGSLVSREISRSLILDNKGETLDRFGVGHLITALDISAFIDYDVFQERTERIITEIKNSTPALNTEEIYLPGEIENKLQKDRLENGIPLPEMIKRKLDEIANEIGINIMH
ncbi:Ldh family oxidoreductase [Oceanobacillus arenosus]|uniref:Ldh family oxidoreductase n=1 Tax=Oceanobacillus arenosus TaxID=1229153 RepID=UPI001474A8E8|nr:Ldh family oxidoreductase [Oceanobacillus arenosus]